MHIASARFCAPEEAHDEPPPTDAPRPWALFFVAFALLASPRIATAGLSAVKLYNQGLDAYEAGRLDEALSLWQQALKVDPDLALAHYIVGLFNMKKYSLDEAIARLNRSS